MTWQSASFLVLGLALFAGFAWYERSRPPAKVLALVAALAALAIVGRIAFAPIPNVKPTTDIVLLAGYALGGAPGFCVGAVTALVSNFFFLQGPWTPWQMAAWGGVGVAGATLAWAVRGRELGRVPLALACGVAGLGFGVVMDLHVWTLGAEQTLASYVAVAGRSLPYNLAHVVANVGFCLLIGPPLVRALRRYRRRTEVRWAAPGAPSAGRRSAGGLAASAGPLAALVVALVVAAALVAAPAADAAGSGKAARYLAKAQNGDGGFGGEPGSSSNQLHTGWAGLGLAAAGRNPRDVSEKGRSVVDYVRRGVGGDTGSLSRTILLLTASGVSPRSFGGRDLVSELRADRRRDGSFDGLVNQTAFAVMALEAAGAGTGKSVRWLEKRQNPNGGYGFNAEDGSPEDTGYVLEALVAAGGRGTGTVSRAVAYMEDRQKASGGFTGDGTQVNAQATAFAVQGLVAAGRSGKEVRRGIGYLRSLQTSNGSIRYARGDGRTPVWVTAEALPALERQPFPLPTVARAPRGSSGAAGGTGAAGAGELATGDAGGGPGGDGGDASAVAGEREGRSSRGAGGRGAGARSRRGPGGPGTLLDDGTEAPGTELVELAKGGAAAVGARSDGSVVGGVIAAASSAALVVGIRRRLHNGLEGEAGAAEGEPPA
jgi:energy-coupling factor transport system substrate-specific component